MLKGTHASFVSAFYFDIDVVKFESQNFECFLNIILLSVSRATSNFGFVLENFEFNFAFLDEHSARGAL